ncbi:hypothetical protein HanPI659440_Chr08g0280631 [Helianthus annuus]|nr:hypothetical protein HanPI659440_Chr08g0280631 [Helianthus annuus]
MVARVLRFLDHQHTHTGNLLFLFLKFGAEVSLDLLHAKILIQYCAKMMYY